MRWVWMTIQGLVALALFLLGAIVVLNARYLGVTDWSDLIRTTEYAVLGEPKTIKLECEFDGESFPSARLMARPQNCMPDPTKVDQNIEALSNFGSTSIYRELAKSVGRIDLVYTDQEEHEVIVPCTFVMVTPRVLLTALHCFILPDIGLLENKLRDGGDRRFKAALHLGFLNELEPSFSRQVMVEIKDHGIKKLLGGERSSGEFRDYALMEIDQAAASEIAEAGYRPALFSAGDIDSQSDLFVIHYPLGSVAHLSRKGCRAEGATEPSGQDALNTRRFKHFCGTLPGTSGAPIFDDRTRKVVALHLAGRRDVVRVDENEGDALPIALIAEDLLEIHEDIRRKLRDDARLSRAPSDHSVLQDSEDASRPSEFIEVQ